MNKIELVQKAFIVYHKGMLSENPYEGYDSIYEIPHIYANSAGQAKSLASEPYDCSLDDEAPKYTDLKVVRAKSRDLVKWGTWQGKRSSAEHIIKNVARTKEIEALPNNKHYYIQDSRNYVGNAVLFWGINSNGYTTDPSKSHQYTKKELLSKTWRETDIIWHADHVKTAVRQFVDAQYLDGKFKL